MLKINKKQTIILLSMLVLAGGIVYYFYINSKQEDMEFLYLEENIIQESNVQKNEIDLEETTIKQEIVIHITGQVVNCGIVRLEENSRIIDAIEAAGGVTIDADLSKINLAFILSDGQKVYIPSIHDEEEKEYVVEGSGEFLEEDGELGQSININTATSQQLQKLPGIGESIANRIISYRNSNGKFEKIEDLKNVSGIGEAKFNNIKEYICVK